MKPALPKPIRLTKQGVRDLSCPSPRNTAYVPFNIVVPIDQRADFRSELTALLNRHSIENGSNTPDVALAQYVIDCIAAFDKAVNARFTR